MFFTEKSAMKAQIRELEEEVENLKDCQRLLLEYLGLSFKPSWMGYHYPTLSETTPKLKPEEEV